MADDAQGPGPGAAPGLPGERSAGDAGGEPGRAPGGSVAPSGSGAAAGAGRCLLLGLLLVAVVAALPSWGTLGAGLISDDGILLGQAHARGALADVATTQADLRTFRFWRPLVSLTLDLQEAMTGVAPAPLRAVNLAGHVVAALLLVGLVRRLGLGLAGAVLVGLAGALFPHQGGTVTWIAGRVDSLLAPLVLGSLLALVGGRSWLAALLGVLALATKETALVLPALGLVVLWMQRAGATEDERAGLPPLGAVLPLAGAVALAFAFRAHAIGHWIGGYPGGLSGVLSGDLLSAVAGRALVAAAGSLGWLTAALGLSLVLALVVRARAGDGAGAADRRPLVLVVGALCLCGLALGPVITNLVGGQVAPHHQRTLLLADLLACLGLGGLVLAAERLGHGARAGATVLLLALVGVRGHAAWTDTRDWAWAGDQAEELVEQGRGLVAGLAPSPLPALVPAPPAEGRGCYVLKFGVADRFRAPFPAAPRPVWPWKPAFELPGQVREPVDVPVAGTGGALRLPVDDPARSVPLLEVRAEGPGSRTGGGAHLGDELATALAALLRVTAPPGHGDPDRPQVAADAGPRLVLPGTPQGARLELLVVTERGYGVARHGGTVPGTGVDGPVLLLELLAAPLDGAPTDAVPVQRLADVLAWAADLGATEAWLELRLLGAGDAVLGVSPWLPLTWDPGLRDHLLPKDSF